MCIIIAKEKYGRLPSEQELKNSFEYNSDGAGFMYVKEGKVVIDKGYMTYNSFIKHYKKLLGEFNDFKGKSLVIHCRIGTSGKNIKENTHPYPITNDERKLRMRHLTQEDIGIVHNGIITGYGTATGLNDTQEFIKKYIYPIYSHFKEFYKNKDLMRGIELITKSKLTILDTDDNLYYVGEFIDDKGLKFSNNTYLFHRYTYKGNTYYTNAYYDDYYYADYGYESYDDWYTRKYEEQKELDKKIEEKTEETKEKIDDKEYLYPLDKDWYIDLYGNGDTVKVGDKDYWYDYETLDLYEWINDTLQLVVSNPIIYNENYEEIW